MPTRTGAGTRVGWRGLRGHVFWLAATDTRGRAAQKGGELRGNRRARALPRTLRFVRRCRDEDTKTCHQDVIEASRVLLRHDANSLTRRKISL